MQHRSEGCDSHKSLLHMTILVSKEKNKNNRNINIEALLEEVENSEKAQVVIQYIHKH